MEHNVEIYHRYVQNADTDAEHLRFKKISGAVPPIAANIASLKIFQFFIF